MINLKVNKYKEIKEEKMKGKEKGIKEGKGGKITARKS
jgi:hypothetical protein